MRDWLIVAAVIVTMVYIIYMSGYITGRTEVRREIEKELAKQGYVLLSSRDRKAMD